MTRIFLLFCLITLFTKSFAQTGAHSHRPTQRIRGVVTDAVTRKPVSFATVTYDTEGLRGVLTDTLGRLILEEIGRAHV